MNWLKSPQSRTGLNALLYLSATAATSCMGLLTAVLMTHLLAPEEYGRIGVFMSVLYIAVPLVSLAAEGLVAVNRTTLPEDEYDRFRRTVAALGLAAFAMLSVLALLLRAIGIVGDLLMLVVPGFALIRLMTTMAATEYVCEQRAGTYAALTILNGALALGLTYGLMKWASASAGSRVAALLVAECLLLFVRYRGRMHLLLKPTIDRKYSRQILAFGLPSLVAVLGGWALNESDKVVVAHGCGLAITGLYTAAATLAAVMMSFNQSLTNALFPGLFVTLKERQVPLTALMRRYVGKFLLVNVTFALLLTLGYLAIKDTMLPSKYAAASQYFYALVLAYLAVAVFRPLGLISEYFKLAKLRAVAITAGGSATLAVAGIGVHVSGNALWAPIGIAVGYLSASVVITLSLKELNPSESLPH